MWLIERSFTCKIGGIIPCALLSQTLHGSRKLWVALREIKVAIFPHRIMRLLLGTTKGRNDRHNGATRLTLTLDLSEVTSYLSRSCPVYARCPPPGLGHCQHILTTVDSKAACRHRGPRNSLVNAGDLITRT